MGTRIEYLDLLKFFAIFCVLLGHSTEQISANIFWDHPLWGFIYTYHMPLFIFLSGFFFRSSLRKSWGAMVRAKAIQLLVPTVTAFAVGVCIMLLLGATAIADLCELSFMGFMNAVWFLKCLFFCCIIMYPLCRLCGQDWVAALVATVLIVFMPGADVVNLNFMLPMFALGMVCGNRIAWLERHWNTGLVASWIAFLAMLPWWSGRLTVYMVPTRVFDWTTCSMDFANLGVTCYRLAIGMAGTLAFFFLSRPIYKSMASWRGCATLCRIGGATLGIYVLQTFTLEIFIHCLHIYVPLPWSWLVAPVIAVLELALCYGLVRLIQRSRIASFLLLGKTGPK